MERDIDMGQAVEEAAKLFADRCRINNFQSLLDYPYDDIDMINAISVDKREGAVTGKSRHSIG